MLSLLKKPFLAAFMVMVMAYPAMAAENNGKMLTLKDSVEATLRNNPTIKAFQEYRQAAEHDVNRASNGYYPRVDLTGGIGMEQWADRDTRRDDYSQEKDKFYGRSDVSLIITQNVFDGWATSSRKQMSKAMLTSAEYRLLDNAEVLSLDAILAHIEILRQQELFKLAQENVNKHEEHRKKQADRQGTVDPRSNLTQAEARLFRAKATLAETQLALQNALNNYKNLTGFLPDVNALSAPLEPSYKTPSLENSLANSMVNNSKVRYKRADVDTSYAQKELDKAANYPRFFIQAGPSYSWQVGSYDNDQWNTSIQLRTEWNLYNGNYDRNNLKGNKARIRQANRELQALRDSLAQETANTWQAWKTAEKQRDFYYDAALKSGETRDMYIQQLDASQRSLLDVLDAENEYFSISIQMVTAEFNAIATQYRLLTLEGRLFSCLEIDGKLLNIATNLDDFGKRDLTGSTVNNHAFMPTEKPQAEEE